MSPAAPRALSRVSAQAQPCSPVALRSQRRAPPPPRALHQPGPGEGAFVTPAPWEETENSHGERSFRGALLSILSPDFPAVPNSPCWGRTGGRRRWACAHVGEDLWASPAWPDCTRTAGWWLLEPFQGIILRSEFQLCRGDQAKVICTRCPYARRKPLAFSLPPDGPCTQLPRAEELCLARQRIKLWFMEKMPSPFPSPSRPPAFSHCHFSLD